MCGTSVQRKHYYHPSVEDVRRAIEYLPDPFKPVCWSKRL
jgi:hypothetical protein